MAQEKKANSKVQWRIMYIIYHIFDAKWCYIYM